MKDKPCQKGNQPCFCNASLSNLSFAFFTRYAYTNFPVTLFNNFFYGDSLSTPKSMRPVQHFTSPLQSQ